MFHGSVGLEGGTTVRLWTENLIELMEFNSIQTVFASPSALPH
jgi:hypothetical protein